MAEYYRCERCQEKLLLEELEGHIHCRLSEPKKPEEDVVLETKDPPKKEAPHG